MMTLAQLELYGNYERDGTHVQQRRMPVEHPNEELPKTPRSTTILQLNLLFRVVLEATHNSFLNYLLTAA